MYTEKLQINELRITGHPPPSTMNLSLSPTAAPPAAVANLAALLTCHASLVAAPLVSGALGMSSSTTLAGNHALLLSIHACKAPSERHHFLTSVYLPGGKPITAVDVYPAL